jgi:O-antigen ligase
MTGSLPFYYAGSVIVLAMLLGGGTQQGLWTDHLIELALLPALFAGLPHIFTNRLAPLAKALALLVLALVLVQFVPVRREIDPGAGVMLGGWGMFSPMPQASLESALFALPLLGFALFVARMDDEMQQRLLRFIVMGFFVNLVAGAIQLSFDERVVAGGMLPFEITAGLFANENHLSALIYAMIPLMAYFYIGRTGPRRAGIALYTLFAVLITGFLFAIGSRAGMAIACVLAVVSALWFVLERAGFATKAAAFAAAAAALALLAWLGGGSQALAGDARWVFFATTWQAIGDHWLTGSGLGTFTTIHAGYEAAGDMANTYANHAHNDYLEIALEAGIAGVLAIGLFLVAIVLHGGRSKLSQAAFIAVCAIALHSLLDYPLRTFALAVPFAWMSAVMLSAGQPRKPMRLEQERDFVAYQPEGAV